MQRITSKTQTQVYLKQSLTGIQLLLAKSIAPMTEAPGVAIPKLQTKLKKIAIGKGSKPIAKERLAKIGAKTMHITRL